MSELFEAAKPFELESPVVFDVPPQTAQSNVIKDAAVNEFSIRPDRQFIYQNTLSSAVTSRNFTSSKNFYITKILIAFDSPGSDPWFTMTLDSAGGTILTYFLFRVRTSANAKEFKDINFTTPLYVNTQNGLNYLTLFETLMVVGDIIQFTIFGFYAD